MTNYQLWAWHTKSGSWIITVNLVKCTRVWLWDLLLIDKKQRKVNVESIVYGLPRGPNINFGWGIKAWLFDV